MIRDIAGVAPLKDALLVTNAHLEAVLAELQETNRQRLEGVTDELRRMNATLETLVSQLSGSVARPAAAQA